MKNFKDLTGKHVELSAETKAVDPPVLGEDFSFLDGDLRVVAKLTYVWGMNRTEVAEIFGMSEAWVTHKIKRVKELLRRSVAIVCILFLSGCGSAPKKVTWRLKDCDKMHPRFRSMFCEFVYEKNKDK